MGQRQLADPNAAGLPGQVELSAVLLSSPSLLAGFLAPWGPLALHGVVGGLPGSSSSAWHPLDSDMISIFLAAKKSSFLRKLCGDPAEGLTPQVCRRGQPVTTQPEMPSTQHPHPPHPGQLLPPPHSGNNWGCQQPPSEISPPSQLSGTDT